MCRSGAGSRGTQNFSMELNRWIDRERDEWAIVRERQVGRKKLREGEGRKNERDDDCILRDTRVLEGVGWWGVARGALSGFSPSTAVPRSYFILRVWGIAYFSRSKARGLQLPDLRFLKYRFLTYRYRWSNKFYLPLFIFITILRKIWRINVSIFYRDSRYKLWKQEIMKDKVHKVEKRVSFRIIRSQSYRCTESGSGPLVKRSTVHLPHGIIHCLYFSTLFQYALRRHRPPCHSSSCRPHFSLSIV